MFELVFTSVVSTYFAGLILLFLLRIVGRKDIESTAMLLRDNLETKTWA